MGIRIQQLSPLVANQIAAGEVIERPASVIKELLENSLDAQADAIHIEINFGGLNLIKVSDNGIGIVADDLPLAIAAHATSKISRLDDLYAIASMGFRGEALASIASISRLILSSKTAAQDHAMMIRVDGTGVELLPCPRSQGSTIEVRDLFYNAPVRKKFLKSERSEYLAIETVVRRFALSAPAIAVNLKHNGKEMLSLPAALCDKTRLLRIKKLLGKTFLEQAGYLDIERAGMRLQGWVSGADYQRSQSDKQWVYINQRMVKDKLVNHAIKQAYEHILYPGRYPACLLYLTMPAQEVDVNVHPTKHEVRFQQPRLVHDLIVSQIAQALVVPVVPVTTQHMEKTQPVMALRENYIKQPLPAALAIGTGKHQRWVVLNSDFALVFLHEQPFLVDIARLQQQRMQTSLPEQSLPFASRPLLVPISYPITAANYQVIEQCQSQLQQLGVELGLISETQVIVRSVPIALPQLDIKRFVEQLLKRTVYDLPQLIKLLIACQSFDTAHLTDEEQEELSHSLQYKLGQSSATKPWCLKLDLENCRDIVHV